MQTKLEYIVDQITVKNSIHSKKIKKNIAKFDDAYFSRAKDFIDTYEVLLEKEGKDLDYAIDCYLHMIDDFKFETIQFMHTGKYSSSSFEEVNKRVYDNPSIMEYYMHGLLLSQFLWAHHYFTLLHFNDLLNQNSSNINTYLEVGGGHGLYISEAIKNIDSKARFDLVDISSSSLNIAKKMISNDTVNYILSDVFDYSPAITYDFITMGEVLEHVEDPLALLEKLHALLSDDGKLFITTPTNAPAIDHIYLFKNIDEINKIIDKAGFKVEKEATFFSEDLPLELMEKHKISILYTGLLVKK
mgnify:CR=1 FL=1